MPITAKFSNGHVDVYKGTRPVKAAWMVVSPTGQVISGHSLDRAKALTTARGNIRYLKGRPMHVNKPGRWTLNQLQYFNGLARDNGFRDAKAAYADYEIKMAAFRDSCKIEVIDL